MNELKPCPAGCKTPPEFEMERDTDGTPMPTVSCQECGFQFMNYNGTEESAVRGWNTRPDREGEIREAIEYAIREYQRFYYDPPSIRGDVRDRVIAAFLASRGNDNG